MLYYSVTDLTACFTVKPPPLCATLPHVDAQLLGCSRPSSYWRARKASLPSTYVQLPPSSSLSSSRSPPATSHHRRNSSQPPHHRPIPHIYSSTSSSRFHRASSQCLAPQQLPLLAVTVSPSPPYAPPSWPDHSRAPFALLSHVLASLSVVDARCLDL